MTKKYLLIILALSLLTRFVFFSHPAETVFDEVHFGKFVSGYFTGQYFFDIHPPLGKLLIAGMAKISGFQPGFSFENIGQKYPDDSYKWLRFPPKLAGALLPLVIFLIALELGISQKFAFLAGLLLVFENSLIAQSRFILLDAFLLIFGFLGILFFLKSGTINFTRSSVTNSSKKYLFLSGIFSSLAFSVKWTGFSFLALILIFYFWNWLKSGQKLKQGVNCLIFLILIPFAIYFSIFALHFSLLDKPGPGLAFHPPNFQEMNVFEKFAGLNSELYRSNIRLGAGHPYTSQWFQWPFMNKPIYYWNSSTNSPQAGARIYFLGNPLIWWLSIIAVIYFTLYLFRNRKNLNHSLLAAGYWLNLLPFIFIGRVMFLYHYLASLVFAVLILTYSLSKLSEKNQKTVFNSVLIGSIALFLFFSPLTYGLAIPEWYYKLMVWLPAWR
ncbi:MAG: phospholipid carrier-dependent glycosyltransferase [Parcubacteria group bacterium]|nr:phospholipid carrier-dependent glycosyltransferase [Parcubacteria group bacterium]